MRQILAAYHNFGMGDDDDDSSEGSASAAGLSSSKADGVGGAGAGEHAPGLLVEPGDSGVVTGRKIAAAVAAVRPKLDAWEAQVGATCRPLPTPWDPPLPDGTPLTPSLTPWDPTRPHGTPPP